jgi:hypothetical protein
MIFLIDLSFDNGISVYKDPCTVSDTRGDASCFFLAREFVVGVNVYAIIIVLCISIDKDHQDH